MDEFIVDHVERILSGTLQGNRVAKSLPVLCGCLGGPVIPEHIRDKLAVLSRQVLLQDVFDTLVGSLNHLTKSTANFNFEPSARGNLVSPSPSPALEHLIAQIEQARLVLSSCEVANQSEIIGWVVGQAKEQKLWGRSKRR